MNEIVMPFDGKRIEVVKDEQGNPWIGVKSVCDAIGIASNKQIEKISKDQSFNRDLMVSVAMDGKKRDVFCIPLNQLNGWLFSINPNKVPEHVKYSLLSYKNECFNVLYNHFMPRGIFDLQPLMDKICEVHREVMNIRGATETIFGDDKDEITQLIEACAKVHNVDGRTVWGWVQTNCDVGSYKRQNNKIKNYLKNLLGQGLKLVKENEK